MRLPLGRATRKFRRLCSIPMLRPGVCCFCGRVRGHLLARAVGVCDGTTRLRELGPWRHGLVAQFAR